MEFKHENLIEYYEDVRTMTRSVIGTGYIFSSREKGGDFMELIVIDNMNEYRFVIDNYPGQRKIYSTNIPYRSFEEFENDLERMRIKEFVKKKNGIV
jgi:hypothetical protein